MRLKLHQFFQQNHRNFQTFSRIENYSIRQNKLKELESNYRKFQLQCNKIHSSSMWPSELSSLESIFKDSNQKQTLAKVLFQGLLNYNLYESKKLEKKVQEIENVTYSNEKFNKKYNPYTLREQNFFNNQERKQKIDMKPFIE